MSVTERWHSQTSMTIDKGTRDKFEDYPVDNNGLILKIGTVQQEPYIFKLITARAFLLHQQQCKA